MVNASITIHEIFRPDDSRGKRVGEWRPALEEIKEQGWDIAYTDGLMLDEVEKRDQDYPIATSARYHEGKATVTETGPSQRKRICYTSSQTVERP